MQLTPYEIECLNEGSVTMQAIVDARQVSRRDVYRAIALAVVCGQVSDTYLRYVRVAEYHALMLAHKAALDAGEVAPAVEPEVISAPIQSPLLSETGYDLDVPEKTPQEAWDEHKSVFEQRVRRSRQHTIVRADDSPFVIAHLTDVHLDDDGTPLAVLEDDIRASHEMGAVIVHGGDALNNWPEGGRLSRKYADQSCTLEDGLLRLRHYIRLARPHVWVDGNHEEFSSHLRYLIDELLADGRVIKDYWRADVTIVSPGGRDLKMAVSHKFQKGKSWFHGMQGHIREILEGGHRDLLLDGHLHSAGVMEHHMPERGTTTLCVASAGYKMVDSFASRISRGGKAPKTSGRAHWIVVDPQAPESGTLCVAFREPEQAKAYLQGLKAARVMGRAAA